MITRWLGEQGAFRVIALDVTALVDETVSCHDVAVDLQLVLAQATVVHALLSAHIKGDEQVSLHLTLDDPRVSYMGQLNADGHYRAYVKGEADGPLDGERLSGMFLAIKSLEGKELYRSASVCERESLERALRRHMEESHQADIWLRVGVRWGDDSPHFAGGLLLERFPESPDKPSLTAQGFAEHIQGFESTPPVALVEHAMNGQLGTGSLMPLDPSHLVWQCQCTTERTEGVLRTLGVQGVRDLAAEQGEATVGCHFCGRERTVSGERLEALAHRWAGEEASS